MKIHSPCLNCPKREIGCHGKCRDFEIYKTDLEIFKQRMKEDKIPLYILTRSR